MQGVSAGKLRLQRREVEEMAGEYNAFSRKLEKILGNLVRDKDLRLRIDDHGIYWGSRYHVHREHFLSFSRLDDASLEEITEFIITGTHAK